MKQGSIGIRDLKSQEIQIAARHENSRMNTDLIRWYRSKVDWWLGLFLCVPPIAAISVMVKSVMAQDWTELAVAVSMVFFVAGLYLGLIFPMRYGIGAGKLIVQFGWARIQIDLASITDVHRTWNPLSSPALSLDRLHVQYGKGIFRAVVISPAERDAFLDHLAAQTKLARSGDRLHTASEPSLGESRSPNQASTSC